MGGVNTLLTVVTVPGDVVGPIVINQKGSFPEVSVSESFVISGAAGVESLLTTWSLQVAVYYTNISILQCFALEQ